ncbi:MAG: rod shape-determining protein MreC [Gammaproteobacteria bacterium]|nr:rod shape-determining protein MreC [Gammaproteobacteria bacterium]
MKPLFTHNPSLNTRLLLALIASSVLFFLDSRMNYFSPVRNVLSVVVYPIQTLASLPSDTSEWMSDFFQSRKELKEKNAQLEAINLSNSIRLQSLQDLQRENMRLRELLGSSFRLPERVKVAEILAIDLDPFSQQVVIDKGEGYDVFIGQAVLDATGVMGQVVKVSKVSSHVILLTNPSHALPVQVNRNGVRAVVTGRGLGKTLQLEHVPHNADIRVGDLLVTSGLGGRFPVGYPVGRVVSVSSAQGQAFAHVLVEPAAKLSTSREVLLVLAAESFSTAEDTEVVGEQVNNE